MLWRFSSNKLCFEWWYSKPYRKAKVIYLDLTELHESDSTLHSHRNVARTRWGFNLILKPQSDYTVRREHTNGRDGQQNQSLYALTFCFGIALGKYKYANKFYYIQYEKRINKGWGDRNRKAGAHTTDLLWEMYVHSEVLSALFSHNSLMHYFSLKKTMMCTQTINSKVNEYLNLGEKWKLKRCDTFLCPSFPNISLYKSVLTYHGKS